MLSLGHGIDVYKPLVCGIHCYCLAAGLDMALACDIRVAAEDASLGMTMIRWGIMAATGATQLPRTIGWTKAMEMLLAAERITAEEEDAKEGPKAFSEKRQPQWTGR